MSKKNIYSKEENKVITTIKNIIHNNIEYPDFYLKFFFNWSLINSWYNASSNETSETKRVVDFGKTHNHLWNEEIEKKSKKLVEKECVGEGKNNKPKPDVISATIYLRNKLMVNSNVCNNCKKNGVPCNNVKNMGFQNLDAIMRIIYQIRCNLFHGDKNELYGDEGDNNKIYVSIANEILTEILRSECFNQPLASR